VPPPCVCPEVKDAPTELPNKAPSKKAVGTVWPIIIAAFLPSTLAI
jgi:hypothetical protein